MARDLKGVMPALLTPFHSQQRLDIESLRRLVRFNIGARDRRAVCRWVYG